MTIIETVSMLCRSGLNDFGLIVSDQAGANNHADAMLRSAWNLRLQFDSNKSALLENGLSESDLQVWKVRLKPFESTRHAGQHAFDPRPGPNKNIPEFHNSYDSISVAVDSTSLVILGDKEIFRGQVNLFDLKILLTEILSKLKS
jgi:hypothetical protein